jgi:NTP pyrophosphatase (non-canonical NTP hydrolase)
LHITERFFLEVKSRVIINTNHWEALMDLDELQGRLRVFASDRNWEKFHSPKNLSMALMVEAAELMELFQWLTPEESRAAKDDSSLKLRIGEELSDVLLYLLQLADHTGVELGKAVEAKLQMNAKKHPIPGVPTPEADGLTKAAQAHVLVDWENVQPKDSDIRALVPDATNVWIFHGPNQRKVGENQKSFGDAVTLIPISRSGNNALDFHLSFYMGYISSRNPSARFVVISNDKGYGPMLDHAKDLGFAAGQVGFRLLNNPPKKATAKKKIVKQAAAHKKTAATKKAVKAEKSEAPPKPTKTVKVAVKKAGAKSLPAKSTVSTVKAPTKATAAKSAPLKKSAVVRKPKTKIAATVSPSGPKLVSQTSASDTKHLEVDEEKAYAHVLASLRKSKNKPTRKVRLFGAVKSLLKGGQADNEAVALVVNRLVKDGHLEIDASGVVTKAP